MASRKFAGSRSWAAHFASADCSGAVFSALTRSRTRCRPRTRAMGAGAGPKSCAPIRRNGASSRASRLPRSKAPACRARRSRSPPYGHRAAHRRRGARRLRRPRTPPRRPTGSRRSPDVRAGTSATARCRAPPRVRPGPRPAASTGTSARRRAGPSPAARDRCRSRRPASAWENCDPWRRAACLRRYPPRPRRSRECAPSARGPSRTGPTTAPSRGRRETAPAPLR